MPNLAHVRATSSYARSAIPGVINTSSVHAESIEKNRAIAIGVSIIYNPESCSMVNADQVFLSEQHCATTVTGGIFRIRVTMTTISVSSAAIRATWRSSVR